MLVTERKRLLFFIFWTLILTFKMKFSYKVSRIETFRRPLLESGVQFIQGIQTALRPITEVYLPRNAGNNGHIMLGLILRSVVSSPITHLVLVRGILALLETLLRQSHIIIQIWIPK